MDVVYTKVMPFQGGFTINFGSWFIDPDGDMLTITVTSSNPSVVEFTHDQNNFNHVTLTMLSGGSTTITVTADDGRGGITSYSFYYGPF